MAIKVGFVSLGCPKNQLDIEVMLSHLLDAGYEITPEETEADIVIINTCAFIESAKKESIDNILDIAWLKEHGNLKGIVVTGCLAERYRDEVINEMPEVDAVLGVGSIHSIAKAVESVAKGEKFSEFENKNTVALGGDRIVTTGDTMAYLKISEGCDNCCTYCAIPKIRGRFRSRPMDDLIKEAAELADMGIKEIVVIGQDTTAYGIDLYGEYKLPTLLSRIANETDVAWIRILYCYPDKITDELINEFKTNPKLVKYIDLPIQHISGNVLKRMNRKGNEKAVRDAIKRLREGVPGIAIRTTAIVGFPGETEEDFLELCEFIKEAKFEHFGAFTYSREENTPAYDFKDQIDEDEKERRYDIIMREQFNIHEQMAQKKIGTECVVLVESFDPVAEVYVSRRSDNAPEIDGKVFIKARKGTLGIGEFINVRIDDAIDDYDFIASVC